MELENNSDNLIDCPICLQGYDETNHIPKIFSCGHSTCSSCIQVEISSCPICRKAISSQEKLNLSTNFSLLQIIHSLQEKKHCSHHPNYEQDHICQDCRSLICLSCSIYGGHRGHNVQPLREFYDRVQSKLKKLEEDGAKLEGFYKDDLEEVKSNVVKKYNDVINIILIMRDNVLLQIEKTFLNEKRFFTETSQPITEFKGFIQDKTTIPSSRALEDSVQLDFEGIRKKLTAIQSNIFWQVGGLEKAVYSQFHRQAIFENNRVDINIVNGKKHLEVNVQAGDKIKKIKAQISLVCPELKTQEYDLIYNKKPLSEDLKVSDYNIQSYIPLEIKFASKNHQVWNLNISIFLFVGSKTEINV